MLRDKKIDILKGIAIILVVIGHTIQFTKGPVYGGGGFFNNPLFSLIYTFHMPLFMLVSGYLFYESLNKYSMRELILKKFKSMIIPILCWNLSFKLLLFILGKSTFDLGNLIFGTLSSYWFLWAVFYCSIGLLIGRNIFGDSIIFHIIVMIVLLITPNILGKDLYGFMYPYFIVGYSAKKHDFNIEKVNFWTVLIPFTVLLVFWDKEKYIYTTGLSLMQGDTPVITLGIDIYRWGIGALGSLIIIKLIDILNKNKKINLSTLIYLGENTLGIYLINPYINIILSRLTIFENFNDLSYTLICVILSIVLIFFSLLIIKVLKINILLNTLFLGGSSKKGNYYLNKKYV